MSEKLGILIEVFKNVVMSNSLAKSLRGKLRGGRTTGGLDVNHSVQHSISTFNQYQAGLQDASLPADYFVNKSIMEIGPGANLGVELQFIAAGAKHAHALDRFPVSQTRKKETEIYSAIIDSLDPAAKQRCQNVYQTINDKPVFKNDQIRYFGNCALEVASQHFDREYDVVCSHLALEHVANLEQAIASTAKILKHSGICIYICNLVSLGGVHNFETEPLRLLYYSDTTWNLMFSNRGGSNRVRVGGYKQLIEKNKFKILSLRPLETMSLEEVRKIKPHFSDRFKSLPDEELQVLKFRIVAQLQ